MTRSSKAGAPRRREHAHARIAFTCLFALGTWATPALAQDRRDAARAAALFREARGLSEQGRHEAACERYDESQKLDPSMGTEFYLAECLERIGDNAGAYLHYASVVKLARAARMKDREAYAGEHMEQVAARVAFLELQLSPETRALPDLEIVVNGREVAIESAARVPVNLGEVRVEVRAEGRRPFRETISASAGAEILTMKVDGLTSGSAGTPGVEAPPPGDDGEGGGDGGTAPATSDGSNTARTVMMTMGGVSVGLGAIGIGIGIGFGVDAFNQWAPFDEETGTCRSREDCPNQFDAADTAASGANVAFGLGIPLAVAGAALLIFAPAEDTGGATTSVGLRVGASRLVVEGTF